MNLLALIVFWVSSVTASGHTCDIGPARRVVVDTNDYRIAWRCVERHYPPSRWSIVLDRGCWDRAPKGVMR